MDTSGEIGELLQTTLFTIGSTETTVGRALAAAGIAFAALLAARVARRLTARHFERRDVHDTIEAKSLATVLGLVVALIGLEIVLHILGIHLTSMLAAGGFLALAAGFAAKNIAENFLSGAMLHIEQTIRPGDVILVNDRWVQIGHLGVRTTTGTTYDGQEILIPNSIVAQSVVTNLTRHDRRARIDCTVGVAYSSDLRLVRSTLESTVAGLEWQSTAEKPAVYLKELADSSVNFMVTVWIDDVGNSLDHKSHLLEAVWWSLKDAGIELAFPQLDVHLHGEGATPERTRPTPSHRKEAT